MNIDEIRKISLVEFLNQLGYQPTGRDSKGLWFYSPCRSERKPSFHVNIIKKFETLHKPRHWPYVRYGHQVQPGEPYRRDCQLTEAQADALLRKDLAKFCALYSQYGKDSVLFGALAYNCGSGVVNKSTVLKKLKRGDRDIFKSYTFHCRYKGKPHAGLRKRCLTELAALYIP